MNLLNRCAFFFGEIDKPVQGILQRAKRKAVNVGICLEGVYVMDVKEKVSTGFPLVDFAKQPNCHASHTLCVCIIGYWLCTVLKYWKQFSSADFSSWTRFLAACAAWPAFQWAFLGPQLPRGGGGLSHSVAGVWWGGRWHSCQQAPKDLFKTSKIVPLN